MNIRALFTIHELRNRILFTLFILMCFRFGATIPIPGVNLKALNDYFAQLQQTGGGNSVINYLDFFAGGAFSRFSIFMLGVVPYISTSIIMQLLVVVLPALKKLQEEGGRKRIQRITRYATVGVSFVQSFIVTQYSRSIPDAVTLPFFWFAVLAMVTVTTGTMLLIWMGEQINLRGIGNGISLIIFAGIIAQMPRAVYVLFQEIQRGLLSPLYLILIVVLFSLVVALVIIEQRGQRKIPIYYAKRIVNRKMYGAQNVYIPFRINPSGVIPVIFASSLLTFPLQIFQGVSNSGSIFSRLSYILRPTGLLYNILFVVLIVFFAYFYTQVTLNPIEIAKNIRENGGTVPGIRSDKIEEYFFRVLNRIILPGALFLSFIAIMPTLAQVFFEFPPEVAFVLGGTSLLILVGVDLDLMSQIEASLKTHHQQSLGKATAKPRRI